MQPRWPGYITINLDQILQQAQQHLSNRDVEQAENLYLQVLAADANNRNAIENLVMICLQSGRAAQAEQYLQRLVTIYPSQPLYCDRLATLLERRGKADEAIACYRRLLQEHPDLKNSRYNLARLLKRSGYADTALQEYQYCLQQGIERPEEVHTNISVIQTDLHQYAAAELSLTQALTLNPDYIPAIFNMALLREEQGDWVNARALYLQLLEQEPRHVNALTHLANGDKVRSPVDPLIRNMKRALRRDDLDSIEREELLYALGKAHDDCGYFDKAFDYYRQANQYSARRSGAYDATGFERITDQLICGCEERWLASIAPASEAAHIFICGMFRSGSTLLEQVLAAHPDITAGGEIDYFQRKVVPFPAIMLAADPKTMRELSQGYTHYLLQHFADAARVSNKRPDNFLYLGLLRALFPNALFINTLRQPLDNCLSLLFQPLEAEQAYANDPLDAGHYYLQQRRLMAHWHRLIGPSMRDVEYETLVQAPRETIAGLLEFLQLDWHEGCMQFHQLSNRVRTASVHQVRQPLYASSSGRWHNYAGKLGPLIDYLNSQGGAG